MITLSEEQKQKALDCGALSYTFTEMADLLEFTNEEVVQEMANVNSEMYKCYMRGRREIVFKTERALLNQVRAGDVSAIPELEAHKADRNKLLTGQENT
ncbi:MAG: hypothetical protein HRU12_08340 [Phaeodactylibacter sp.]|nr:hypothetical protein [Phaeodactylibacter sp.]